VALIEVHERHNGHMAVIVESLVIILILTDQQLTWITLCITQ